MLLSIYRHGGAALSTNKSFRVNRAADYNAAIFPCKSWFTDIKPSVLMHSVLNYKQTFEFDCSEPFIQGHVIKIDIHMSALDIQFGAIGLAHPWPSLFQQEPQHL